MVAYNVQSVVVTEHHLIVMHGVTNVGTDRSQLAHMGQAAKAALHTDNLDAKSIPASTLREVFRERREVIVRQARIGIT
jgi:hypothetical protein